MLAICTLFIAANICQVIDIYNWKKADSLQNLIQNNSSFETVATVELILFWSGQWLFTYNYLVSMARTDKMRRIYLPIYGWTISLIIILIFTL